MALTRSPLPGCRLSSASGPYPPVPPVDSVCSRHRFLRRRRCVFGRSHGPHADGRLGCGRREWVLQWMPHRHRCCRGIGVVMGWLPAETAVTGSSGLAVLTLDSIAPEARDDLRAEARPALALPLLAAILSGLLMSATFWPLNAHWLAWIALIPWLVMLPSTSPRQTWLCGAALGLAFYAIGLAWLVEVDRMTGAYSHPRVVGVDGAGFSGGPLADGSMFAAGHALGRAADLRGTGGPALRGAPAAALSVPGPWLQPVAEPLDRPDRQPRRRIRDLLPDRPGQRGRRPGRHAPILARPPAGSRVSRGRARAGHPFATGRLLPPASHPVRVHPGDPR